MVYEIGCSNYEAIYLPESKQSFKSRSDDQKRPKHCWEEDRNFDWE